MSKGYVNFGSKPIRYHVFFQAAEDEKDNFRHDNFVSYNAELDRCYDVDNKKLATAKAHAVFAAQKYNGLVFMEFAGQKDLVPLKPQKPNDRQKA